MAWIPIQSEQRKKKFIQLFSFSSNSSTMEKQGHGHIPDDCWELTFKKMRQDDERDWILYLWTRDLVSDKHILLVAKALPPLKKLELVGFDFGDQYLEISLKLLLLACQLTLEELTLGSFPLTDTSISELAQHPSSLTFIELDDCSVVTFYTLTKSCPLLEKLKMTLMRGQGMDTFCLDYLLKNNRMWHLDISSNTWLTDMNLQNFGQVSDVFGRYYVDLSVLNLKTLRTRRMQIDDEGMTMIGNRCLNLRYLDIGSCKKLTDEGVMEAVRNCQRLREINLFECKKVSSDILHQMVLSRPSLRRIGLPRFDDLSEQMMKEFLSFGCWLSVPSTELF
ncbi:uncharacterized protein LOC131326346 [Rhododendron vialii]|uniref:uncharacterized protein LOC131326346 n=1 Tax=Rhododendron vialii TaxID=182163 RepID=UPI0026605168|nr:uncharacterized protein LOC131326346 [Rhododendron vialii]